MSKKSIIYKLSIVLLIIGLFFIFNAQMNITGAVIGAPFDPVRNSGIGFALIFISMVLFIVEASDLEKKLDFKDIDKKIKEVQNINATQDFVYDKMGGVIRESTKGEGGWLDIYKLDTDKGKEEAYKSAMTLATSKDNPFYKKIEGISKEHSEYIGLRTIGLDPFDLKKTIYRLGKGIVGKIDELKQEEDAVRLKKKLGMLPFADIKEENIDDIVEYTIPKDIKLDKKPRTVSDAVTLLSQYYLNEGKLGEGQLKQMEYYKKAA